MITKYISDPNNLILCVIPANLDLANSQILRLVLSVDRSRQRAIGCLTKIDIMDRGDDATGILMNSWVELKYGFVGVKNRCPQHLIDKKTVKWSLEDEKRFFSESPIYSRLPKEVTGTQALIRKITKIFYQKIKHTLPQILQQIKRRKQEVKQKLQKMGQSVESLEEMTAYAWKMASTFMSAYKHSLEGVRDGSLEGDLLGPKIKNRFSEFYLNEIEQDALEAKSDREVEQAMYNYCSCIPGTVSGDAFLALLRDPLNRLKVPAFDLVESIYKDAEEAVSQLVGKLLTKKFPSFN